MPVYLVAISLAVIGLAFWRRDVFLYIMSCPVAVMMGLNCYTTYRTPYAMVVSIVLVGIGIYAVIKAFENIAGKV